jgi:two-component system response regulator VicR
MNTDFHIFIVEDDKDIAEILQDNLQREGYKISSSKDGAKALEAIVKTIPDLVVLDLNLPGMSGFEVGADDYVTKPFSPRELLSRIKVLLKRSNKKILKVFHPDPSNIPHSNVKEMTFRSGGVFQNKLQLKYDCNRIVILEF